MIRALLTVFMLAAAMRTAGVPDAGGAELLANGGFEEGTAGWSANAGNLESVTTPVHSGVSAGRLSGSGPTAHFVFQWVNAQPAEHYQLSGWATMLGGGLSRLFFRVELYDASGQSLLFRKDSDWLPLSDGTYYFLTTGDFVSPSAAGQARVSVVVQADSDFTAHIDELAFAGPEAIPVTPTPPASPAPTPTPPSGVEPTDTPSPQSTPTRTPPQSATLGPTSSAPPVVEPEVFAELTNAGFEELRQDGTPFGWRKQGGDMSSVMSPRTEGARSVALTSQTNSTKWLYQTIAIVGGAYYHASVDAFAGGGSEAAFLRLSWYTSADGSGQAISSTDSREPANAGAGFVRMTTGATQAPAQAASVKLRLMLRPASGAPAVAYFDSAELIPVAPGEGGEAGAGAVYEPAGGPIAGAVLPVIEPDASGGATTPFALANVKPPANETSARSPAAGGDGNWWAVFLAIAIAVAAIGLAGGYELWQRRQKEPGAGSDS